MPRTIVDTARSGEWSKVAAKPAEQLIAWDITLALMKNDPDSHGIGTLRYPLIVPKDAECAERLKARALTALYNERSTWLAIAHQKLDAAVFAAYGWDPAMSDEGILENLLALNLGRAGEEGAKLER